MLDCPLDKTTKAISSGPPGLAYISPDLEERLGQSISAAGGHSGHPGRLGMEHGRAHSHQRCRDDDRLETMGNRKQQKADEGRGEPDRQRKGLGTTVRIMTHDRLEQGGRQLIRQSQQAYLPEAQVEGTLEHREH